MLDLLGIPYTGSNATTLNVCLHKARAKETLAYHGVPVAKHVIVTEPPDAPPPFGFPAMVKPLHEGSSKGVRDSGLVRDLAALRAEADRICSGYGQPALVEEFLPGREFTVALVGNPPSVRVLPIVEIKFDSLPEGANPLYSYEAKWIWDVPERPLEIFECPARIDDPLRRRIGAVCRRAFELLECADWSRIDVRLDAAGEPNILEVNPLPGILPNPEENSCFPKAARAAGIGYAELLLGVVEAACRRRGIPVHEEAVAPL
jgi:D-alanine-D-alanine ligase